jgi:hypothetical protein
MPASRNSPNPPGHPVRLTELPLGTLARIHANHLEREDWALLAALGLSNRSLVRICQAGNPWIVQVRETRIGLSDAVAAKILVIPAAG